MELVYMWIKEYGHLKDIGLNFGGEIFFRVKKKENIEYEIEITKENNPHHIKNFFNIYKDKDKDNGKDKNLNKDKVNIINVTAIIGENGAGKSTILEIIQTIGPKVKDALFILKNENEYIRTELIDPDNTNNKFTETKPISKDKIPNVILYSNVFQTSNFKKYYRKNDNTFFDLSTMKYLYEEKYRTKQLETALSEYGLDELNRQMVFVSNFYEIITDDFEFEMPSVITIIDSHPNQNKEDEIDKEKIENLFDDINSKEVKQFFKKMDFSNYIHDTFDFPSSLHKIMKSIFLQWLLNISNSEEAKIEVLIKKILKYSESPEKFYTFLQSLKNKKLDNLLEIFEVLVKVAHNYHKYKRPLTTTMTENILGNFNKDKENISKLVSLLKETDYTSNLLQFKWRDMSSGEVAILTLFSRFHSIKHKIKSDNILILLDEPDMYLNPSWVQKFINVFIEYLNKDFSGKTIQIILTSNKPICTSDLPPHSVVRLKKSGKIDEKTNWPITIVKEDDSYQSFGANIYSLYRDGFFLNEGFMGSFAKRKIQEVIEWLNDDSNFEDEENIKKIIEIIGEPVLRDKLRMMFRDKMELRNDKNSSRK